MAIKRILLETGMGNDWHGKDYTKAAVRAVQDALHHSSLTFLRTLHIDPATMAVNVTIGVQSPEKVRAEAVKAAVPHGQITVTVVKGGLDVPNGGLDDMSVIAVAGIAVQLNVGEPRVAAR